MSILLGASLLALSECVYGFEEDKHLVTELLRGEEVDFMTWVCLRFNRMTAAPG